MASTAARPGPSHAGPWPAGEWFRLGHVRSRQEQMWHALRGDGIAAPIGVARARQREHTQPAIHHEARVGQTHLRVLNPYFPTLHCCACRVPGDCILAPSHAVLGFSGVLQWGTVAAGRDAAWAVRRLLAATGLLFVPRDLVCSFREYIDLPATGLQRCDNFGVGVCALEMSHIFAGSFRHSRIGPLPYEP